MSELERIATALESLLELAKELAPPPILPNPPAKPFGADHVTYLDDEQLWEQEQEQIRLRERGLLENESSED